MRKILFIFPTQFGYFPDIYEYCRLLLRAGYEVTYVGTDDSRPAIELLDRNFKSLIVPAGGDFHLHAAQIIRREQPHLVHVFHFRGAGMLRLRALGSKARWVVDVRTLHVGDVYGKMSMLKLRNKITALETLPYQHVLALTNKIKQTLSPHLRPIRVVPLGASAEKFCCEQRLKVRADVRKRLSLADMDVVLVYAGSLSPSRRLETLLQYFAKATYGNPHVKLLLLGGDGLEGRHIETLKNAATPNIFFLGRIRYTEVQDYYHAADIGLSYMPPGTPHEHQPPTKLLEYMQARLLAFCNYTPSQADLIGAQERGIIYENHYDDFADKLQMAVKVVRHNQQGERVQAALNYVQQFSWEHIVANHLIPFYNSVLSNQD